MFEFRMRSEPNQLRRIHNATMWYNPLKRLLMRNRLLSRFYLKLIVGISKTD